jgi:hypothetical protein
MVGYLAEHQYEFIYFPTLGQLSRAVCYWDNAARQFGLDYALVGSIVARFRAYTNEELQINSIEILVRPIALANNAQILKDMKDQRPDILGLTATTNELVVIIEGNKLIRLHFSATGTKHYPKDLIPPIPLPIPITGHLYLQPTFGWVCLIVDQIYYRWVPFIRCRDLLLQRLLRFNSYSTDNDQRRQNYRDITDIELFLRCTAVDQDDPFPVGVASMLLPTVNEYIQYATNNNTPCTDAARLEWRRLGLLV